MRCLRKIALIGLGGAVALLPVSSARSQEAKERTKKVAQAPEAPDRIITATAASTASAITPPIYKPPLRGAPGGRLGGGTRGSAREACVVAALAPDHSGLTAQERPSLYWYISTPTSLPVEFTLVDPDAVDPVARIALPSPTRAGIHVIRLSEHGVSLAPGVTYRWYVAVVPDADRRSRDILAGGTIQRLSLPADVADKVSRARPEDLPAVYAEAGFWYDALATMSELVDRAPEDRTLQQARASLISQIGLSAITVPQ